MEYVWISLSNKCSTILSIHTQAPWRGGLLWLVIRWPRAPTTHGNVGHDPGGHGQHWTLCGASHLGGWRSWTSRKFRRFKARKNVTCVFLGAVLQKAHYCKVLQNYIRPKTVWGIFRIYPLTQDAIVANEDLAWEPQTSQIMSCCSSGDEESASHGWGGRSTECFFLQSSTAIHSFNLT